MDIQNFSEKGPRETLTGNEDRRWWVKTGEECAKAISATLVRLRDQQTARLTQYTISVRLYGNLSVFAVAGQAANHYAQMNALMRDRITYNAIQSATDTITAKVAKNRPKPLFLTSGGNYQQQRKAKRLNKFVDGVFYENRAYELGVECFRDGSVVGDGLIHVYAENKRIRFERVLASELWVDEQEAVYGYPRQLSRTKDVDRLVLMDLVKGWGKTEKEKQELVGYVANAERKKFENGALQETSDLIEVRESWHLPSGPKPTEDDPKGGKHVISIEGHTLLKEPWLRDHFPFARFRWCPRMIGFWSQGGAEQVQQIQFEINKLMGVIQRSFELGGTFTWLLDNSCKVPEGHLNNRIGKIIRYAGPNKPEVIVPTLVQPEILNQLIVLKNAIFEQYGISQLSATSQKPAGLNSGVALREYNDIETDRFQTIGHAYEDFYMQLARLTVETAKEIAGRGSYKVNVPGRRFIESIDWQDVNLSEDQYVMQCFPVSSLPRDPAGRLQTIQEYMQAGLINPRQGKRLLDFPDLDHIEDLSNAAEDYLTEILDRILDDGEFIAPEPEDDLLLAQELVLEYIAHAKSQHVEPERIELLRRFRGRIDDLQKLAAQLAAANAPPEVIPQANPQAPPTSDLIQNMPGLQPVA